MFAKVETEKFPLGQVVVVARDRFLFSQRELRKALEHHAGLDGLSTRESKSILTAFRKGNPIVSVIQYEEGQRQLSIHTLADQPLTIIEY